MSRKVSQLSESYPTENRVLVCLRALYGDWNWSLSNGYIRYHLGKGPRLYEHRLVIEVLYGRQAERFHAHHIDGCKTNNDPSNLKVLDPSTHTKIHRLLSKRPSKKVTRQCAVCEKTVVREPHDAKRHKLSFCNKECYRVHMMTVGLDGRRYIEPPEKEELAKLIQTHSRDEIASMYGCGKTTVSRWIARYGLVRGREKTNQ